MTLPPSPLCLYAALTPRQAPLCELELLQSHMAQKLVLRGEVGCACVAREKCLLLDVCLSVPQCQGPAPCVSGIEHADEGCGGSCAGASSSTRPRSPGMASQVAFVLSFSQGLWVRTWRYWGPFGHGSSREACGPMLGSLVSAGSVRRAQPCNDFCAYRRIWPRSRRRNGLPGVRSTKVGLGRKVAIVKPMLIVAVAVLSLTMLESREKPDLKPREGRRPNPARRRRLCPVQREAVRCRHPACLYHPAHRRTGAHLTDRQYQGRCNRGRFCRCRQCW